MKKLLVLALSALLVLGLATASMAAATLSGEIDVKVKGTNVPDLTTTPESPDGVYRDFTFGKIVLNGKLGDDLTGTLVVKGDNVTSGVAWDEASLLFTEDWGTFKAGYYGWNNNLKDILDVVTNDIKSDTTLSVGFAVTDNIKLGLAYAYTGNQYNADGDYKNPYAADLGFAGDNFGLNLLYFNYGDVSGDTDTAWGVNAYIVLDAFKPFAQYRSETLASDTKTNFILGATWTPANAPLEARIEADLSTEMDYDYTPWGVRLGYKLENGAKLEVQYKNLGVNSNYEYYAQIIAPF